MNDSVNSSIAKDDISKSSSPISFSKKERDSMKCSSALHAKDKEYCEIVSEQEASPEEKDELTTEKKVLTFAHGEPGTVNGDEAHAIGYLPLNLLMPQPTSSFSMVLEPWNKTAARGYNNATITPDSSSS
jgi:hypothetical protein